MAMRLAPVQYVWAPAALVALVMTAAGLGVLALAPLAGVVAFALILATRLEHLALALLTVALVMDNPGERPMEGEWKSPLYPLGALLYENLHQHTGIGALRFSALEAAVAGLFVLLIYRRLRRDRLDDPRHLSGQRNPMRSAFAFMFAALVALEVYGLARGGDFRQSLWQARQLFWLPLLGVLFGHALKTPESRRTLLRVLLGAAWVRNLVGIYFTFAIARPQGLELEYVMTHSDAILTVVAILIGVALFIERPTASHLLLNVVSQPVLLLGLHVNDRRIALVGLAGGLLALVLMGPAWIRQVVRRGLIVLVPLVLLYIAVGWSSTSPIFGPVATLRAMSSSEDASSQTRDIENYNLIQTLKRNPLIGSGFGHEYYEEVQAYRVDTVFAQYRYIAHNSVLWLISLGGWLGFAGVWAVFPAGMLVALRAHACARPGLDRVLAFAAVAAIVSMTVQAWGDMGLQSWMGTLVVASLLGAAGALLTERAADAATEGLA